MKILKTTLFTLLVVFGNVMWAQQPNCKTAEERAANQAKRLTEKLGLNASQEKSIYTLALQNVQQQDADRAKHKGDRKSLRNARKQNMDRYDAGLAKILNTNQNTKYEQLKAEQKAKYQPSGVLRAGHKIE